MEDEKITLDRKTFKTLASETRINILKSLDQRRKTLSELSKQYGMSVSTISEHLKNLSEAGLVLQKDEGHSWKYYELTGKGRGILYPDTKKIWIMLSISAIAIFFLGFDILNSNRGPLVGDALRSPPATTLPWTHITGIIIFTVLLGTSMFLLYRKRSIRNFLNKN